MDLLEKAPEMARKAQQRYRGPFEHPDVALDGSRFLTGSAEAIDVLTNTLGFHDRRLEDRM